MSDTPPEPDQNISELTRLTSWGMLLTHWTSLARNSVALPQDQQGNAWRASIPALIGLQAHVLALAEIDGLPEDERAVGLDRASVGIGTHETTLLEAWAGQETPEGVTDLIIDARSALRAAREAQAP